MLVNNKKTSRAISSISELTYAEWEIAKRCVDHAFLQALGSCCLTEADKRRLVSMCAGGEDPHADPNGAYGVSGI